jgi:hypothetical protein
LGADWLHSRWRPDDQRGKGNRVTPQKVVETVSLIWTGEIVSLGMPDDNRICLGAIRLHEA